MLAYVRAALRPVFAEDVWMVVGHRAQMVEAAFPDARWFRSLSAQVTRSDAGSAA